MANKKKPVEDQGATPTREVEVEAPFEPTPDVDPTSPGSSLSLKLPPGTPNEEIFAVRAKLYKIKGRSNGPAVVQPGKSVMLPCGDIAQAGDTFDPIEEHMSLGRFSSLVTRKYVKVDDKAKAKIVKAYKGDE